MTYRLVPADLFERMEEFVHQVASNRLFSGSSARETAQVIHAELLRPRAPIAPSVPPEMVERLVKVVREVAQQTRTTPECLTTFIWSRLVDEICELAALLPEPVDPDLIEARKICESIPPLGKAYASGAQDNTFAMQIALASVRRGKELAVSTNLGGGGI